MVRGIRGNTTWLVYLTLDTPSTHSALPGSESRAGWSTCQPSPRAPSPPVRRYRSGGDVTDHLTGRYPSVLATTGSCAGSIILPSASQSSWSFRSWPVAVGPGWTSILPDLISRRLESVGWTFSGASGAESFPGCLAPYPGGSLGALLVSSLGTSAFPTLGRVGFPYDTPHGDLVRTHFRSCRHFFMFRPPGLLATQVAPTAAGQFPQGGHGFYVRAPHG